MMEAKIKMKSKFKAAICILLGIAVPCYYITKLQQNCINKWKKDAEKNRGLFLLMNQWVNIKQKGKSLKSYFEKNNLKKIAVYGMSYVGMQLLNELKDSEIEVAYGIDRNADNINSDIKLITMDDDFEDVDAVVITTLTGFDEICDALSRKIDCYFISIEDILNEI